MAVATGTALAIGGMAAAGAIAGSMKDKSGTTSGLDAGQATGAERTGQYGMLDAYTQLQGMVKAGPGEADVKAGYGAQTDLAAMLDQYAKGGYNPSEGDISTANGQASALFGGQRVAMQQAFADQQTDFDRRAGLSGRNINDPIFMNKLAQEQTRQRALLEANQGSLAMQLAMQAPQQRLGYATQRTNLLGGLATQAMQNRQLIASMGEGIMNNERNFRLATAQRYGTQESGGGLKGAISGFIGGAGAGASMASGMGGAGMMGSQLSGLGGAQAAPSFAGAQQYFAQPAPVFGSQFGGQQARGFTLGGY